MLARASIIHVFAVYYLPFPCMFPDDGIRTHSPAQCYSNGIYWVVNDILMSLVDVVDQGLQNLLFTSQYMPDRSIIIVAGDPVG